MFKKTLILLFLLFWAMPVLADVDIAWIRRYNGPGNHYDVAHAIAVDGCGNVYVTGESYGGRKTTRDYAVIKYYPNGNTAWVRRYNGPDSLLDHACAIAVDDSGNVYVTGYSDQRTGWPHNKDYATIKYDANGDTAWVRRYNGPGNRSDWAHAIAVDGSGNVYVAGYSAQNSTWPWNLDYATIKYSPEGNKLWVKRYNGYANWDDEPMDLVIDCYDDLYVTGFSYESGNESYTTIKYYANGDAAWVRNYTGPGSRRARANALTLDSWGNLYVTGWRSSPDWTQRDYATIRYDLQGNELWARIYIAPGNYWEGATCIVVDDSGNVFVSGSTEGNGTYLDYTTIKYDPDGNELWVRRYNGLGDSTDLALAIAVDGSGNVYVTGWSYGVGTASDYATVKYDPNGDEQWVERYNGWGNGRDEAYAISVDSCCNVYVTGGSWGVGRVYDYATIKYVQTGTDVGDETGSRERPSEFTLSQNYPNPFNQTTKIEFTLAKSGFVSLNIYDILGRKVKTLVSERVSSGYKSVLWDGKNEQREEVASGIYFYQLRVGDFCDTKKLVLLK